MLTTKQKKMLKGEMWKNYNSLYIGSVKTVQVLKKTVWRFLKNWKIKLTYDLASTTRLGLADVSQRDSCASTSTTAQFIAAEIQKQTKYPGTNREDTVSNPTESTSVLSEERSLAFYYSIGEPGIHHANWNTQKNPLWSQEWGPQTGVTKNSQIPRNREEWWYMELEGGE